METVMALTVPVLLAFWYNTSTMLSARKFPGFTNDELRGWIVKIWCLPIYGAYQCSKAMKIKIKEAETAEGVYFASPSVKKPGLEDESDLDI